MQISIGNHTHKGKHKSYLYAIKNQIAQYSINGIDTNVSQIFVHNPRIDKRLKLQKTDELKKYIEDNNIKLYVHCSHPTTGIWQSTGESEDKRFTSLNSQLSLAESIGACGVVLHLMKRPLSMHIDKLKKFQKVRVNNVPILLENPSLKSSEDTFDLPHKLNALDSALTEAKLNGYGLCIDTAHLWSCISEEDRENGYTIETKAGAKKWIKGLNKSTKSRIKLIHLNGSANAHSAGSDKHNVPIYGIVNEPDHIWGKYINNIEKSSLIVFIKFAKKYSIPMIMEINRGTPDDIYDGYSAIADIDKLI